MANTVLDRIRKLDEEKSRLLDEAKAQAMGKAQEAINELNELGFHYRLTETGAPTRTGTRTGTRRSGIRDNVYDAVKGAGEEGITRAQLLDMMGVRGDKSGEQSVSNALAALNKTEKVNLANGVYTVV